MAAPRFRFRDRAGTDRTAQTVEEIAAALSGGSLDPDSPVFIAASDRSHPARELAALADATPVPPATVGASHEELLAAFVGRNWERHYRDRFRRLQERPGALTWNWAAALVPFWLAYQRRVGLQVLSATAVILAVSWIVATAELHVQLFPLVPVGPFAIAYLVISVVHGLIGDRLVHGRADGALPKALGHRDRERALAAMRTSARSGLDDAIVVLLGGLFLWFGVTMLQGFLWHDHSRSYVAAMRSDLRNLITAQESYFADAVTYAPAVSAMPGGWYATSPSVTVTIVGATGTGFSATATHPHIPGVTCGIWVGSATPPVAGALEAQPRCEGARRHSWLW